MYKVDLTRGEIRAIISYYDNANHYLEDVCENYDIIHKDNVVTESVEEAKAHIRARVGYLMNKLDMGR